MKRTTKPSVVFWGKSMARKVNPRRVPKTQADVDAARDKGIVDGVSYASALFMNVLLDKFSFDRDQIQEIWQEMGKLSESVLEGRVTIPDIKCMLKEEYGIEV